MKKSLLFFLSFASLLLFTSCLEIREEVDLNVDGSGRILFTIDMRESKSNLSNYLRSGKVDGYAIPSQADIEKDLAKMKRSLSSVAGISEVDVQSDFQEFVFKIGMDFDKVSTLNLAINTAAQAMNKSPFPVIKLDNFDFTERSFRRYFDYPIYWIDFNELSLMQQYLLESAKITGVYRFQRPVKACTNAKAQISPTKRAVLLQSSLSDLVKGNTSLVNSVIF
jgi:hypothetical protein